MDIYGDSNVPIAYSRSRNLSPEQLKERKKGIEKMKADARVGHFIMKIFHNIEIILYYLSGKRMRKPLPWEAVSGLARPLTSKDNR